MIKKELLIPEIKNIFKKIQPFILKTPLVNNLNNASELLNTDLSFKMEFFQNGGTFKARGAINNVLSLKKKEKNKGVIAVSAGNHAIAVAYASSILKVNSKVIMYKNSNLFRLQKVKSLNSDVILADPKKSFL